MSTKPFYKPAKPIAITGGPGAGKTAILEIARRHMCAHVEVLPEAAALVFGGGFPRREDVAARRAAQRAIFHVQAELEAMALANDELATILCDRGTIDGLAYWPGHPSDFFSELHTSLYEELARYHAVIHLHVPEDPTAYRGTSIRRESHREARELDARLFEVWSTHPNRVVIDATGDFLLKTHETIMAIRNVMGDHECTPQALSGAGSSRRSTG